MCIDDPLFAPDLYKDNRVKLTQNEMYNNAFIAETNQVMWSLLTNTIPHGRTIVLMVTPATEASMMAVGHFTEIFHLGKNGLQLTDDFVMRLKNEFASNDLNVVFSYIPSQDDDMERSAEMCSLEMFMLQSANMNDKVIIMADSGHLLDQIRLLGHPESEKRKSSILASSSLPSPHCYQTITSKLATRKKHSCRCYVLPELHKTASMPPRLHQCRQDLSMSGARLHKAETSNTQSITTWDPTFNHEVDVDVFEIVDSVGMITYDRAWIVRESDSRFSIVTCMSANIRTWLDTLGWLA